MTIGLFLQLVRQSFFNGNDTQRRFVAALAENRNAAESNPVAGSYDHHRIVCPAADQFVSMGRDVSRIQVAGMRGDQPDDIAVNRHFGNGIKILFDVPAQNGRISRIPGTGYH